MSAITYEGSTLTITNEATISSDQINQYNKANNCVISSTGDVTIKKGAFKGFTSLQLLSFQVNNLILENQCFQQIKGIPEIKGSATDSINIGSNACNSAGIGRIEFHASKHITIGDSCFKQILISKDISLFSDGTIDVKFESFKDASANLVHIESNNNIDIGQRAFDSCNYVKNLQIQSNNGGVAVGYSAFQFSTLYQFTIKSHNNLILNGRSMQNVNNFYQITFETNENFNATYQSFINTSVTQLCVICGGIATFHQQTFQQTHDLYNLTVLANKRIEFQYQSFYYSFIGTMILVSNGTIHFDQQSFKQIYKMRYLYIDSKGPIIFEYQSFYNSDIYSVSITADDSINFGKQSFKESFEMYSVWIRSSADVTFQVDSFSRSEIQELYISLLNTALSDELSTIKFEQNSMSSCEYLRIVDINTTSMVDIQKSSFNNDKALKIVNVYTDKNVTVGDNAFGGCSLLNYANIVAQNKDVSYCAYGGCKGRRSSSNRDEDDISQTSAKALGNIEIKTVYIGYSPNIIVSLNFLANFMRKVRVLFGHIIPPPELVHSAIWISDKDANDDTIGAVFVYGRYFNKYNHTAYLNDDGAKAYKMSFKEFKGRYSLNGPMKLKIHKKIMLFDFINEVVASGKWTARDYNWPTNNCQHFTATLIKILKASRITPNNNDWLEIPKPILDSLKQNEITKKI